MTKPKKLDLEAVRNRAKSVTGCREVPTRCSGLVSFLVGLDEENRNENQLARVNIFTDTGTVGTCRVLNGVVRQSFQLNVTALDVVERLLRNPSRSTTIDKRLVSMNEKKSQASEVLSPRNTALVPRTQINPTTLKAEIELADIGVAILQSEREKIVRHLESLEHAQTENNATPSKSEAEDSTHANTEFQFSLPPDAMKHVDQCLHDINSMGKLVRSIATNGKGTVFLYGNGGVAYTPCIPRALHHKLSQLRNSPYAARPSYVSLGSRDRYFVTFYDGTFIYKGPKGLDRELKKVEASPLSVAFGSSWDTFFIVYHDGSWKCQGREIPEELEEKLADRGDRPDLSCVNLGPNGEWFLRARNGRLWWGGISHELDTAIQELLAAGNYLNFLNFGEDGSYLVTYD